MTLIWLGIAIAAHLLGVVWWIGGLAFVTLVVLPALRQGLVDDPQSVFDAIERRFTPQARSAVLLTGLSGGYLLWALDAWSWLTQAQFWWLDAMLAYWLIFFLILFIVEPLGLMHRLFFTGHDPARAFRLFHRLHSMLLILGLVIIGAAAAGSHGW